MGISFSPLVSQPLPLSLAKVLLCVALCCLFCVAFVFDSLCALLSLVSFFCLVVFVVFFCSGARPWVFPTGVRVKWWAFPVFLSVLLSACALSCLVCLVLFDGDAFFLFVPVFLLLALPCCVVDFVVGVRGGFCFVFCVTASAQTCVFKQEAPAAPRSA